MKKAIVIAVIAVLVTVTILVWFLNSERPINIKGFSIGAIQVVVLGFAVFVVYKRWKAANPDRVAKHKRDWEKKYPERTNKFRKRALLNELKDAPCVDCGVRYPHYVMDFDHVRGEKVDSCARIALSKLEEEAAKCDLVCANCHRERTHG